jgi:hypothetical protein
MRIHWECTNLITADFGATGGLAPVRSNKKKMMMIIFINKRTK